MIRWLLSPLIFLAYLFGFLSECLHRAVPNKAGPYNGRLRDWIVSVLVLAAVVLAVLALAGCTQLPRNEVDLSQKTTEDATKTTQKAAGDTIGEAKGIKADADKGLTLTPPALMNTFKPIWMDIGERADRIVVIQEKASPEIIGAINTLNATVKQLGDKLDKSEAARAEAEKATAAAERNRIIAFWSLGILIVTVGVALWVAIRDWRIPVVVVAAGFTMIILAIIVGKVLAVAGTAVMWILIVGGSAIALAAIYTVAETIWRKELGISWWQALKAAIHTSPLQDYQDLLAKAKVKVGGAVPPQTPTP